MLEKIIKMLKIIIYEDYEENKYKSAEYLLTPTEIKFYKIIKEITDNIGLCVFVQVAMYEIIKTERIDNFNKIKSKTMDFVITDRDTKIKKCIELDDYTHKYKYRIKRDEFVNRVFQQANIPLLRIKVNNYYNKEELQKLIIE